MKIKIKPLSANELWQGRKYKTKKYDAYISEMLWLLPKKLNIDPENIHVIFHLKKKTYSLSDTDNFLKGFSDILKKKGLIKDDRYIKKWTIEKVLSDEYYIEIVELAKRSPLNKNKDEEMIPLLASTAQSKKYLAKLNAMNASENEE